MTNSLYRLDAGATASADLLPSRSTTHAPALRLIQYP